MFTAFTRIVRFVLAALVCCIAIPAGPCFADWQAGAARLNITPGEAMWMPGYGGRDHPAEGKLTDLWAKTLVLQDGDGARVAIVTLDLVGLDRDTELGIRNRVAEEYDIPVANTALFSSHTHTGPVVGANLKAMYEIDDQQWELVDAYTAKLIDGVVASVGEAIGDLEPAALTWGNGFASFAVNRRTNREPDVPMLREQGLLQGPSDHDVPVLAVRCGENLKAVVFGYACHATVLSFYQWSGDYPGFAQISVEETYPGTLAMFWAGCGADQNPLPRRQVEQAQEYGQRLAAAVDETLKGRMHKISGNLQTVYNEIDLEFGPLPTREALESASQSDNKYERGRARFLLEKWDADGGLSQTYPYPIQTWRLGDGPTWVSLGGEVVVDFSIRIKWEIGLDDTWVAGYDNDVMDYIPCGRGGMKGPVG